MSVQPEKASSRGANGTSAAAPPRPPPSGAAAVAGQEHNVAEDVEEEEEDAGYSVDHLSAVVRPVALTMILASVAVGQIRDPIQDASISSGLSNYLVYNEGSSSGGGGGSAGGSADSTQVFTQAIINAIVIVSVIAAATFVLVLCYYFRCLKLMVAYLIFASINLLGYTGGYMVVSAVQLWHVIVDWGTLGFIMYNFAIGGAVAVFWQRGVPRIVTQGYLVAVSVIMAWILTKLPEWTSWVLLVVLALYDLCAVLTPCGPLKALIALAQVRKDPIPGLLYEANVGNSANASAVRDTFVTERGAGRPASTAPTRGTPVVPTNTYVAPAVTTVADMPPPAASRSAVTPAARTPGGQAKIGPERAAAAALRSTKNSSDAAAAMHLQDVEEGVASAPAPVQNVLRTATHGRKQSEEDAVAAVEAHLAAERAAAAGRPPMSAADAAAMAEAEAIAAAAEAAAAAEGQLEDEGPQDRSIKLGLGDFVFYSVLVSRAALFDVATMCATFVSVIVGLGGTLFLLGVFKKALPALPISIFLGVAFYFLTRLVVTPMIVELTLNGVTV